VRRPHVLGSEQATIRRHHGGGVDVMWAVTIYIYVNEYYICSNPLNMSEEGRVVIFILSSYTIKINEPLFIKDIALI